jgi:carbamate kinase
VYERRDASFLAHERGWTVAPDGDRWRRVVPSPEPKQIVELSSIQVLVDSGRTVICSGGGGIPVARDLSGALVGVEAVIDKDLSAALLAASLGADALILLTDVDAVYLDWGTPAQQALHATSAAELRRLELPAGSMGPKVEAICRFAESGGRLAAIGGLHEAAAILAGRSGTVIGSVVPAAT